MTRIQVPATAKTRKRRRRRRAFTLAGYIVVVFGLAWYFESKGTTTIIFVRHADTDLHGEAGPDTPLNVTGRARAEVLADFLENIDVVAGPDAIYVSEYRHTQQTAEPLAKRLGIEIEIEDPYDVEGFMSKVLWDHKREIVLVVTHRELIAPLVEELHGSKNLEPIGPAEYHKLYIVTIPWWGKVKTLEQRYTPRGWTPPAEPCSSQASSNGFCVNDPSSASDG